MDRRSAVRLRMQRILRALRWLISYNPCHISGTGGRGSLIHDTLRYPIGERAAAEPVCVPRSREDFRHRFWLWYDILRYLNILRRLRHHTLTMTEQGTLDCIFTQAEDWRAWPIKAWSGVWSYCTPSSLFAFVLAATSERERPVEVYLWIFPASISIARNISLSPSSTRTSW